MKVKKYVVDAETGEYINAMYDGDRITRDMSVNYLESTEALNNGKNYVKVYDESIIMLLEENLSGADIKVVLSLLPLIRYDSGLIGYPNGNHLKASSIPERCGLSEKTAYKSLETLTLKRIFAKVRVGREIKLYANPFIFMRGVRANKTLVSMFDKSRYAK